MVSKALKVMVFVIIVVVALFVYAAIKNTNAKGSYDDFAKCLTEKGARMYGAYWCNHCKNQKADFGYSFKFVDYIECTQTPDECSKASINGYPTWTFADGSRHEGEISFKKLADKTGCKFKNNIAQ